MDLETLLRDPPRLHADERGNLVSWQPDDELLRFIYRTTTPASHTLETGAGMSTLVFAIRNTHHTAVVPDAAQAERIVDWCRRHAVPTDRLTFEIEPSERVLPRLGDQPLDLVLIDGAHGFPAPFLDWYYAGRRVRVGGTVIVDDTQIWTGKVLRDFLAAEPQWHLSHEVFLRFAAARRIADGPVGEWLDQPYVLRRSLDQFSPSRPHRTVAKAVRFARRSVRASQLIRRGDVAAVRRKIRSR